MSTIEQNVIAPASRSPADSVTDFDQGPRRCFVAFHRRKVNKERFACHSRACVFLEKEMAQQLQHTNLEVGQ